MNSEELKSLLKSLQEAQSPSQPIPHPVIRPSPASTYGTASLAQANDVDSILNVLRGINNPNNPVASSSQQPYDDAPLHSSTSTSSVEPRNSIEVIDVDAYDPVTFPPGAGGKRDRRQMTFAESLPILTSLCNDPDFCRDMDSLSRQQKDWELRIVDQRNRLLNDVRKGSQKGAALKTFDLDVLKQFDELKREQQDRLERLRVPSFCVTSEPVILERQRRVLSTLEGMLEEIQVDE